MLLKEIRKQLKPLLKELIQSLKPLIKEIVIASAKEYAREQARKRLPENVRKLSYGIEIVNTPSWEHNI